jgi:hypothetical protein
MPSLYFKMDRGWQLAVLRDPKVAREQEKENGA